MRCNTSGATPSSAARAEPESPLARSHGCGRSECVVDEIESLRVGAMACVVGTAGGAATTLFAGPLPRGAGVSAVGFLACFAGWGALGPAAPPGGPPILPFSLGITHTF